MIKTRKERTEKPFLPATASRARLGDLPLGSPHSRAAVRSLIAARTKSEADGLRFQAVSILDGEPVNFEGLAELIREARLKNETGERTATLQETGAAGQTGRIGLPERPAGEDTGKDAEI